MHLNSDIRTERAPASPAVFIRIIRGSLTSGHRKPDGEAESEKRLSAPPYNFTHCDCGAVALLPVGSGLHDLRRLRTLCEVRPGFSLCVYPAAGTSTWTGTAVHRNRMHRTGGGSCSLRFGKPGQGGSLSRSKAVAICSRELSSRCESILCLGEDCGLRVKTERTTMKDRLDDIPVAYLLYVLLATVAIVAAGVIVIVKMF